MRDGDVRVPVGEGEARLERPRELLIGLGDKRRRRLSVREGEGEKRLQRLSVRGGEGVNRLRGGDLLRNRLSRSRS